jgi:tRNA-splicing endonuclease subunit Sen34
MSLVPPLLTAQEPIQLHIASDKAYVYDVDAIRRLRVDHHITGITLGTLPQVAQQNVFLGVPLQLLPEEVAVLVQERESVLHGDFSQLENG